MKTSYKCLETQKFNSEYFSLVPIRWMDRYKIMQWRNEQMFHLRQNKVLNIENQDAYFENIISKLFDQEEPNLILFSLIKDEECIGYGGLVHIDREQKKAEISLLIDPKLEKTHFKNLWLSFLFLIEKIAFQQIALNEIFTYSYEVRPKLYPILDQAGFIEKERISNVIQQNNNSIDALIHSKRKIRLSNRLVKHSDAQLLFDWASDPLTRNNSLNSVKITWEEHLKWLDQKINDPNTNMYLFLNKKEPIGVLRLEDKNNSIKLSFSVDYKHRGRGVGGHIIAFALSEFPQKEFTAEVIDRNKHSRDIFIKNKFKIDHVLESVNHKIIYYKKLPYGDY